MFSVALPAVSNESSISTNMVSSPWFAATSALTHSHTRFSLCCDSAYIAKKVDQVRRMRASLRIYPFPPTHKAKTALINCVARGSQQQCWSHPTSCLRHGKVQYNPADSQGSSPAAVRTNPARVGGELGSQSGRVSVGFTVGDPRSNLNPTIQQHAYARFESHAHTSVTPRSHSR